MDGSDWPQFFSLSPLVANSKNNESTPVDWIKNSYQHDLNTVSENKRKQTATVPVSFHFIRFMPPVFAVR
jgi:hypothetical protein